MQLQLLKSDQKGSENVHNGKKGFEKKPTSLKNSDGLRKLKNFVLFWLIEKCVRQIFFIQKKSGKIYMPRKKYVRGAPLLHTPFFRAATPRLNPFGFFRQGLLVLVRYWLAFLSQVIMKKLLNFRSHYIF